jgi:hypothetical protein
MIRIIGVDWRDSPKEDKQKFTKMCEVSIIEYLKSEFIKSFN